MSDHQPQRRPHRVLVPRQVPAPVGEDEGAHHPGGGAGDGENLGAGGEGGGIKAVRFHIMPTYRLIVLAGARSRI